MVFSISFKHVMAASPVMAANAGSIFVNHPVLEFSAYSMQMKHLTAHNWQK